MRTVLSAARRRLVRAVYAGTSGLRRRLPDERLHVVRVHEGAALVRGLFRESFGDDPPVDPTHYLAMMTTHEALLRIVGYVHVAQRSGYGLIGGLCVDRHHRRRHIARLLVERVLADAEQPVYFAQVVHPASIGICAALGFAPTGVGSVYARWSPELSAGERDEMLREVGSLGLF